MGLLSVRSLGAASTVAVRAASMMAEAALKSERVWGCLCCLLGMVGLFVDEWVFIVDGFSTMLVHPSQWHTGIQASLRSIIP